MKKSFIKNKLEYDDGMDEDVDDIDEAVEEDVDEDDELSYNKDDKNTIIDITTDGISRDEYYKLPNNSLIDPDLNECSICNRFFSSSILSFITDSYICWHCIIWTNDINTEEGRNLIEGLYGINYQQYYEICKPGHANNGTCFLGDNCCLCNFIDEKNNKINKIIDDAITLEI